MKCLRVSEWIEEDDKVNKDVEETHKDLGHIDNMMAMVKTVMFLHLDAIS